MIVQQVMDRLVLVHDFMLHRLPADARVEDMMLYAEGGRFMVALDMGGRRDLGEALRDKLTETYVAAGIAFAFTETGRRYGDTDRTFTFDTEQEKVVLMGMPSDAALKIFDEHPADNEPDVPAGDGDPDGQA